MTNCQQVPETTSHGDLESEDGHAIQWMVSLSNCIPKLLDNRLRITEESIYRIKPQSKSASCGAIFEFVGSASILEVVKVFISKFSIIERQQCRAMILCQMFVNEMVRWMTSFVEDKALRK